MYSGIIVGNWMTKLFNTKHNMSTTQGICNLTWVTQKKELQMWWESMSSPFVLPGTSPVTHLRQLTSLPSWRIKRKLFWLELFNLSSTYTQIRTLTEAENYQKFWFGGIWSRATNRSEAVSWLSLGISQMFMTLYWGAVQSCCKNQK